MPKISVVMPVKDAAATLESQLNALSEQSYAGPWELIVADNGSADETLQTVDRWEHKLPDVRIVHALERRGANHARNAGARIARGDLLLFCDADDVVTPRWIESMCVAANDFDLIGGKLDRQSLNDPVIQMWRPPVADQGLPMALSFLPYAETANFGVWRHIFDALGGWNEDYIGGAEDVEFCWRAQLEGYRLGFAPEAVIRYRYRTSIRALTRQVYRYAFTQVQLYRDFREHGVPRHDVALALKKWVWLASRTPLLLKSSGHRGAWLRMVSVRWGRLMGSVHFKVLYL